MSQHATQADLSAAIISIDSPNLSCPSPNLLTSAPTEAPMTPPNLLLGPTTTAAAAAAVDSDILDSNHTLYHCQIHQPSSTSTPSAMLIDGSEELILSNSEYLTQHEVLKRCICQVKQLARIYRNTYWALVEDLKVRYREYYWEFGKSSYEEDEMKKNNGKGEVWDVGSQVTAGNSELNIGNDGDISTNKCQVHGSKSKAMALTSFCHKHILSDEKQKLY